MRPAPVILWFRLDLRLRDNPALRAMIETGRPVIPVYVWNAAAGEPWQEGAAVRWWLHHSLAALDASLRRLGSRLVLRRGDPAKALRALAADTGAAAVFWNRRHEPAIAAGDARVAAALAAAGVEARTFADAGCLFEPGSVLNSSGRPFQVFTPFWRRCAGLRVPAPLPAPRGAISAPVKWPPSESLGALGLLPAGDWAGGFHSVWEPGEAGAHRRLDRFRKTAVDRYPQDRDRPDVDGVSRLSPHLHFGEISPRVVWEALDSRRSMSPGIGAGAYLRQIVWREFAIHLLHHFPNTPEEPLHAEFRAFPWARRPGALRAWQQGRTGCPIVDAGMRELWRTGWMHNRARMIAGSFLAKDLRLPWQEGARWFWDTLVDADLANNTLGWQWTAGCGADAAPFFRIFNPVAQGRRFDPDGAYVRRWVPELAALPARYLHEPSAAPADVLAAAGVELGRTYPLPIVSHAAAREAALDAYHEMRAKRATVPPS